MNADDFNDEPSMKRDGLVHEELSRSIIGCAMTVLNTLRPGLDEKIYENALALELMAHGHSVERQKQFPVVYREVQIGKGIPDLIVDGKVVVDPKVVDGFNETHMAQMQGYLNLTSLELALLINFKHARLAWKRVVNEHNR